MDYLSLGLEGYLMNVFDILGPVMIGPSSSHTAGAVRIGKIARIVLGEQIIKADVYLHGSFAETYLGHGTDRAIVGGLLGFATDDERIREAVAIAAKVGIQVTFHKSNLGEVHPNTAKIISSGVSGKTISIVASSVGGGNIKVINVLGFSVNFSGQYHTLIIPHLDRPGTVGAVVGVLAGKGINIAQMYVTRERLGLQAMMVIETDEECDLETMETLNTISTLLSVTLVKPL